MSHSEEPAMPVRISKFINGYVTPEDVGPDLKTRKGLPPFMLSFTSDYKPVMTWNTTRTCNLRCKHCYADSESKVYNGELSHEESLKMLDDMAEYGVPILLFSGGEPLMRKRVFELMAYARKIGVRPTLSTNGTLISRQVADNMKKAGLGYAGISMDGIGATNDEFRGKEGAFDDMVKGVDNCVAAGVKVSLRFTVTQHNAQDLPKVFDFLEQKNLPRMCIYHLVYSGRGSDIMSDDVERKFSRSIVDQIIERAEYYHKQGLEKDILTIDNHCDGPYLIIKLRERGNHKLADDIYQLLLKQGGNRSGIGFGDVDNLGNVHADQFSWDYSWGNVKTKTFRQIWDGISNETIAAYKYRRPLIKGRCGKCQFFEICNGNFRAGAKYATGDNWESDPACYLTDAEIGVYKDANGVFHSHDPKTEEETEVLKQKAEHFRGLGYNVPLAMAADAIACLSALPKSVSENYLAQAKIIGSSEAAKAAEAEYTKPDPKRLAAVEALKPEACAEAEKAVGTNPSLENVGV
jgi:radical SAM protein with 4Fe4S-binding SPASM domain